MPTEPERDIEKTLRAYAKKRREDPGAPAEMHPATRRLLQGEVARLQGGKAPGKPNFWAQLFGGSWPRIAINVSIFVVLAATAAVLMLPSLSRSKMQSKQALAEYRLRDIEDVHGNRRLALNSPSAPVDMPPQQNASESANEHRAAAKQSQNVYRLVVPAQETEAKKNIASLEVTPLTAQSSPPASSVEKDSLDRNVPAKPPLSEYVQTTPAVNNSAESLAAVADQSEGRLGMKQDQTKSLNKYPPAIAPPVAVAAPASPPTDVAGVFDGGFTNHIAAPATVALNAGSAVSAGEFANAAMDQLQVGTNSFAQQFARAKQQEKMPQRLRSINQVVLRSFRVEQTGNQIRIIDSDGSVYTGGLTLAEGDKRKIEGRGEVMTVAPGAAGVVSGLQTRATNSVSLGQQVQPLQYFYFRVSGTNLSLRQPVLFNGNFVPAVSPTLSGKSFGGAGGGGNNSFGPVAGPAVWPLLDTPLQGRVVVGGSNQIEIKALPVKR